MDLFMSSGGITSILYANEEEEKTLILTMFSLIKFAITVPNKTP